MQYRRSYTLDAAKADRDTGSMLNTTDAELLAAVQADPFHSHAGELVELDVLQTVLACEDAWAEVFGEESSRGLH